MPVVPKKQKKRLVGKISQLIEKNPELPVVTASQAGWTYAVNTFLPETFHPEAWEELISDCGVSKMVTFPEGDVLFSCDALGTEEKRKYLQEVYADTAIGSMTGPEITDLWRGLHWQQVILVRVNADAAVR